MRSKYWRGTKLRINGDRVYHNLQTGRLALKKDNRYLTTLTEDELDEVQKQISA